MLRRPVIETALVLAILAVLTAVIAVTGTDLAVSIPFCLDGSWSTGNLFPWHQLYVIDRSPAIVLALAGLILSGLSYRNPSLLQWRKAGVFLVLYLVIGPGLIVNSGFKQNWGRPRPREIVQCGGKKEFLQPWQKGVAGGGRSFPSGHASAAFYMMAPFFIYRRRKPRLAYIWLTAGVLFGVLMSVARVIQGGHFVSDNLWAFGIVYLTGLWLAEAMKLDKDLTTSLLPRKE